MKENRILYTKYLHKLQQMDSDDLFAAANFTIKKNQSRSIFIQKIYIENLIIYN